MTRINGKRTFRLPSAMQALSDKSGVRKERLLQDKRSRLERFTLSRSLSKKLEVPAKFIQVPKSGPIQLSGKALSKIADHACLTLASQAGSHIDTLTASLLGGPLALESTLNGDCQRAARIGFQANKSMTGACEHPTTVWAKHSDTSPETLSENTWLIS